VKRVFTEYVRGLEEGEPPADTFQELWEALRSALRSELSRRGLAHSSPSYLGIYGHETWSEPAFEELLAECYSFVFLDRWRSLKAQLRIKPNVDGLVFLNIRHFLHERQERHDPLGYQVFRALHAEVALAVERGELRVLAGDPRVRNETTLGFVTAGAGHPPGEGDTAAVVRRWSEALAPAFVEGRGGGARSERIREAWGELSRSGIERFRFRDLLDPLKTAARLRWAALLEQSQAARGVAASAGMSALVDLVALDRPRDDEESFRALASEVTLAIEDLDVDEPRREHLRRLWRFVVAHAADPATDGDDVPSFRKTGAQLQIPREALPSLYGTLAGLVRERRGGRSRKDGRYISKEAQ
jgi:hypothetical protein